MAALFRTVPASHPSSREDRRWTLTDMRLSHWLPAFTCLMLGLSVWTPPEKHVAPSLAGASLHPTLLAMTSSIPSLQIGLPCPAVPNSGGSPTLAPWHPLPSGMEHNVWFSSLPAPAAWRE